MTEVSPPSRYQFDIYFGARQDVRPELPLTYPALEARARQLLGDGPYGYVAGGAGSEDTMRENLEAFRRWRIVPRMLVDVSERDLSVELFGDRLPVPVLLAPIGVQTIVHPHGEVASARAAARLGVPFIQSTAATKPPEEVAEAMGDALRWYQLYWPADPEMATSFVQRAEKAGYRAVVITLDTKQLAWRPRDLGNAYLPFLWGEGIGTYVTDAVFRAALDRPPEEDLDGAVMHWARILADLSHSWSDLAAVKEHTSLPVLLKGVLHPDDARAALEHGVDGLVVSNHGGRQVDGAVAALDALPGVVEAVGGRVPVLFDSGVRGGADVVKALSLGATAVLLGRPYIWGLAAAGERGVRQVLQALLAEVDLTMSLSGQRSVRDLGPELLTPSPR